jgi:tRNA(Arg) A34 adenosine deaminase TadA
MIAPIAPKEKFMEAAIKEASKAKEAGDYSIGAVIVKGQNVVSKGQNQTKSREDPTCHAEMVAIRKAVKKLGRRHLNGCVLYTTHEPCPMCASAVVWAKMKGLVCGTQIKDMTNYAKLNGNKKYLWRTIKIPASTILKKSDEDIFIVEEFMRDKCKKLFHN